MVWMMAHLASCCCCCSALLRLAARVLSPAALLDSVRPGGVAGGVTSGGL